MLCAVSIGAIVILGIVPQPQWVKDKEQAESAAEAAKDDADEKARLAKYEADQKASMAKYEALQRKMNMTVSDETRTLIVECGLFENAYGKSSFQYEARGCRNLPNPYMPETWH